MFVFELNGCGFESHLCHSNIYHHSIAKNPIDANYSDLTREIETNSKLPKFKVGDRVRKKYLQLILCLKNNPWTYKIKDLNGEKIIGSFYESKLLLNKL